MNYTLRRWRITDLENLVKYANNWNIAKNLRDIFPFPYTEKDGKSYIEIATKDNQNHIFAIDISGQAVGSIGIFVKDDVYRRNAELGYWLGEPFWGKGIMSSAVREIVEIAFHNYDIDRIFASLFGTNISSQKVLEKNGFILEGKFEKILIKNGEILDELVYAIRRDNWKK